MNLDNLLTPVAGPSVAGDDLSFSSEFDAIQESRRADDPTLDQGDWVTALKTADWPGVLAQCEALFARTKDLRVAAWLTEARAHVSGFAGLADGLELCGALCERFWADLHPQLDDDGDAEQRTGSLHWLLSQVEALVRQLLVLRRGERAFSLRDIDAAQAASARSDERSDDAAASVAASVSVDDIAAARRSTSHEFFIANLTHARRAQEALTQLQRFIDAQVGAAGPGFSGARGALDAAVHAIELMARETNPALAVAPDLPGSDASLREEAIEVGPAGPLRTRSDALRQLRSVADFFRRTEPHSPVAYLAERAAQWGDMPLHQWLRTVVKDQAALSHMEELLGVEPPAPRDA